MSDKNINTMILAMICGIGVFIWNGVTEGPQKAADAIAIIQQQTAEIKTSVTAMSSTINDLNEKLDQNTKKTADQQARIAGLEASVRNNEASVSKINDQLQEMKRGN